MPGFESWNTLTVTPFIVCDPVTVDTLTKVFPPIVSRGPSTTWPRYRHRFPNVSGKYWSALATVWVVEAAFAGVPTPPTMTISIPTTMPAPVPTILPHIGFSPLRRRLETVVTVP